MTANTIPAAVWTPEQSAQVERDYTASPTPETVERLAAELGKSTRSIIAKLSKAGCYVKPAKRTKSGAPVESKEDKVERIASLLMVKVDRVRGLEFANKSTLDLISDALAKAQVTALAEAVVGAAIAEAADAADAADAE
jgi:hypothetical protein